MDEIEEQAEIAQTERIGLGDLVIVGIIALLTFGAAQLWEFPGLYPGIWSDAAVASGVRPAGHVAPGFWTALTSLVYSVCGVNGGTAALRFLGHLFLAGVAVCVYAVLREWLAFAMRMRPQFSRRRTLVMRMASALGAAAIVAADPVWIAGQCLSETTIHFGLALGAIECFFVFLRKGTIKYAYLCALLLGLLSADTPIGFVLMGILIAVNIFIIKYMPALESPLFDPVIMEVGKWHMTFIFLSAFVGGVAVNCWTYVSHGGLAATGGSFGDVPLTYLLDYWKCLSGAGDLGAWILWLGVCIVPFVIATIKFPESADEEQYLPYASGLIFFVCGALAFAQSGFIPSLWFWTYFPMNSQFVLALGLFCCAATLALSVTILGVDSLCRDHARLADQAFGEIPMEVEDDEEEDEEENPAVRMRRPVSANNVGVSASTTFMRRLCIVVVPLFMLALMFPARIQSVTRQMLEVISDTVEEIVREAADKKYLFTDGNLDEAIEIEAARAGSPLKCYSLMGGNDSLRTHLRTRNITDKEDLFSFQHDTGMGLRTWIRDKPARLEESAALMGFDLWKRDGKPIPPMGGLLSLPTGFSSEKERQRGVEAAHALISRVLAIHALPGGVKACTDKRIARAFYTVQWRLARMCLYRGEADDAAGRTDEAIAEAKLAKELNDCNQIYKDMVAAMEKRNGTLLQQLTPREGLQLALVRADFTLGHIYAETILNADPENPDANFAMGMYYMQQRQLSRAERYLLRCLIRKPNEPAVYNNLAMIEIELKKFGAARVNVEKALKIIPDSTAVLETKKALEAAIQAE